jgi:hypothetical protein
MILRREDIDSRLAGRSPYDQGIIPRSNYTWDAFLMIKGPDFFACPFCPFAHQCAKVAGYVYTADQEIKRDPSLLEFFQWTLIPKSLSISTG